MGWKREAAPAPQQASGAAQGKVWWTTRAGPYWVRWTAFILIAGLAVAGVVWARLPVAAAAPHATSAQVAGQGALAIVGAGGATLYASPGGEQIASLAAGAVLTAVGRSGDNLWVVVVQSSGPSGWVEVDQVVLFGLADLPVMIEGSAPVAPAQPAQGVPAAGSTDTAAPAAPAALPTLTPTATPSPTPLPTATPTPSPSPTPSPTPTPEPTPLVIGGSQGSLVAVVRSGGAPLYDRPEGSVIAQLTTGTALTAWGRSQDSGWLVVTTSTSVPGWVQAARVVAFNLDALRVVEGTATSPDVAANEPAPPPNEMPAESSPGEPQPSGSEIYATVSLTGTRLNIRSGPSTGYAILGKALPGEAYVATGRDGQAAWVEIVTPDLGNGFGWVAAEFITLSGPIGSLPVSDRTGQMAPAVVAPSTVPAAATRPSVAALPAGQQVTGSGPTGLRGRLVFQVSSGGTIYVYELETGGLYELTGGFDPAISPDGRMVAFTRIGGENGLYLIDIDGRNERQVFSGSEYLRAPTWSPDGRWIAFVRLAGSYECRDLGFGLCLGDNPFLEGFPLENRPEWGLSRVDANGQQYRDLPALTSVQAPDWHEHGIVYGAVSSLEITQDDPAATTKALITENYYQDPAWQPGGDRIVFQSREGSHWEIFAMNADGSSAGALTRPVTTLVDELPSNVAPAWSPDGEMIIYLSNRDAQNSAGAWRLWVMNADGSNQRPLPLDVTFEYAYANEQVVSWGISG